MNAAIRLTLCSQLHMPAKRIAAGDKEKLLTKLVTALKNDMVHMINFSPLLLFFSLPLLLASVCLPLLQYSVLLPLPAIRRMISRPTLQGDDVKEWKFGGDSLFTGSLT
eukprot:TRINITY_DN3701_c0_g1_i1.p2 TRINITY_DN3701_c0_g1~~TRINITY_DN3701_c0_g1_i1.p2  ORF type:complete len:109 (-),score=14.35 TRINITY_DN3701_c0_g1_i1:1088-1414(-)